MTRREIHDVVELLRAGGAPRAGGRARRGRGRTAQRLPDHAVPLLGDQRPQGRVRRLAREPRALRARDRACDPRRGRRRLLPRFKISAVEHTTSSCRGCRRATRSRSRCRCAAGSRRPASTTSTSRRAAASRTRATRPGSSRSRTREDLRHDASRAGSTPSATTSSSAPGRSTGLRAGGGTRAARKRRHRGDQPRRLAARSSRSVERPRRLHRRLPDRLGDRGRDRARRLRRRHDRAAADREPRPRRACSSEGLDRAPKPCTYCNKCLISFSREPARLLRGEPLRLPRGDDRARSCRSTTAAVYEAAPR